MLWGGGFPFSCRGNGQISASSRHLFRWLTVNGCEISSKEPPMIDIICSAMIDCSSRAVRDEFASTRVASTSMTFHHRLRQPLFICLVVTEVADSKLESGVIRRAGRRARRRFIKKEI
jgi:hypothetical protein